MVAATWVSRTDDTTMALRTVLESGSRRVLQLAILAMVQAAERSSIGGSRREQQGTGAHGHRNGCQTETGEHELAERHAKTVVAAGLQTQQRRQ